MSLADQVSSAKAEIRKLKRCYPYMFTQYIHMLHAEARLKKAKEEYEAARKTWKELGQ